MVNWKYGLVHGIGNIIGAQIAARLSITKKPKFCENINSYNNDDYFS